VRFDCAQPRYNVLHREIETELLPLCREEGIGVIVFNPLAGGLLSGKHRPGAEPEPGGRFGERLGATGVTYRRRYWQRESLEAVARLRAFFEARGKTMPGVAVAWVLAQPGVSAAIVGASSAGQLDATLAGSSLVLDPDELAALDEVWYELPRRRPDPGPVR
jgi:aryl-alcohol dehydrogenase (NADP+)